MGKFPPNLPKPIEITLVKTGKNEWSLPRTVKIALLGGRRSKQFSNLGTISAPKLADKTTFSSQNPKSDHPGVLEFNSKKESFNVEEKRKLIQNHLFSLLHAVICRVMNELIAKNGNIVPQVSD